MIDRRVASILSLSAVPVVKAPGCPFALRPRYRRRSASESPQMLILRSRLTSVPSRLGVPCHPVALFESPDCSFNSSWASSLDCLQVALVPASLDVADSVRLESPRNFLPRLIRVCFRRLRLLPHLRLVDDYSLAESNFASSACAADESSVPIRYQHSWSGFQRILNLNPQSAIGRSRTLNQNRCLRLSPGRSCCSNQLQSHQLVRDSRPDRSVDASAKPQ